MGIIGCFDGKNDICFPRLSESYIVYSNGDIVGVCSESVYVIGRVNLISSWIYCIVYSWPELMIFRDMMGLGGQPLVLGPTVDTYVEYD